MSDSSPKLSSDSTQEPSPKGWPLKRLILVFLLFTGAGLAWLWSQTGDVNFLKAGLWQLGQHPWLLVLMVVLLFLEWGSDYLRYLVLARYMGVKMPFRFGMQVVFAHLAFAYLTPGGSFGAPVVIYMLRKNGEKLSNSIALAVVKPFFLFFVMLAGGAVVFLAGNFEMSVKTQGIIWASGAVVGALTLLMMVAVFRPKTALRWNTALFALIRKFLKRRNHPMNRIDRMEDGFRTTLEAFAMLGSGGWVAIALALFTTCLNLFFVIALSVTLLFALGFDISQTQGWFYSFLYYFVIAFAPTPGASGLAEGGGYLFFQHLGPMSLVSSYVVMWRMLTCYLVISIGAYMFVRFLRDVQPTEVKTSPATPPQPILVSPQLVELHDVPPSEEESEDVSNVDATHPTENK
ncbi:MAG: flippase-like domain-containing protein [Deltaproteobacteria bacterium]|nr:MAG: flippase-like domain-containing protein [Deltaproteobacteria bacterium]